MQLSVRDGRQAALEALLEVVAVKPSGEVLFTKDVYDKLAV